jgi:hypothetical protein
MNALDFEGDNMDSMNNRRKAAVQQFLDRLTYGHYQITSMSANLRMAMRMAKRTCERKLVLIGGMSEVSKCICRSFVVSFPSSTHGVG